MPREAPHKGRGGTDGHERRYACSRHQRRRRHFYEIAGRGGLGGAAARELLAGKLAVGAIISDGPCARVPPRPAALGVSARIASKREEHAINRVNSLHSAGWGIKKKKALSHGRFGVWPPVKAYFLFD